MGPEKRLNTQGANRMLRTGGLLLGYREVYTAWTVVLFQESLRKVDTGS